MTRAEQRKFIRSLMLAQLSAILDNVELLPEEWDGLELREYITDRAARDCLMRWEAGRYGIHRARMRAYRNELATRGI